MGKPRIAPAPWRPPKAPPRSGPLARNEHLGAAERWEFPPGMTGGEDVAVSPDGRVYTGVEGGSILCFPPDGGSPDVVADTGGRPEGIEVAADGSLVVCDAYRGLLRVTTGGEVEVLVDAEREGLGLTNNATLAADGTIYFTDSTPFGFDEYLADFFEHRARGRLLAHDPASGTTRVVLDGLYFANGVTFAPDGRSLLVAETSAYRITRVWLAGERAGEREPFAENLPGFPDNLSTSADGTIWCALVNARDPMVDLMMPYPRVRRLAWKLPDRLRPDARPYAGAIGLGDDGRTRHFLEDPKGRRFRFTTGVREHDGWLYLASLEEPALARVRVG